MRYILCLTLFLLAGCVAPQLSSDNRPVDEMLLEAPIVLNASQIRIENQNPVRLEAPHIETRLEIPPDAALKNWVEKRFQPLGTGRMSTAAFVIQEASLTETPEDISGFFFINRVKYLLTMRVQLVFEQTGREVYRQTVGGWESRTIGRRSSLAEKEEVWREMTETLIAKLDRKLLDQLRTETVPTLIAAP